MLTRLILVKSINGAELIFGQPMNLRILIYKNNKSPNPRKISVRELWACREELVDEGKKEGRKRGREEGKKHSNQSLHAKDNWDLNGTSKVPLIFGIFVFKEISLKTILSRMFHSNLWMKRCTVGKKVKKVENAVRRRGEKGGDAGEMQKIEKMGICIFSMSGAHSITTMRWHQLLAYWHLFQSRQVFNPQAHHVNIIPFPI